MGNPLQSYSTERHLLFAIHRMWTPTPSVRLNRSWAHCYSINLPQRDVRLSWPGYRQKLELRGLIFGPPCHPVYWTLLTSIVCCAVCAIFSCSKRSIASSLFFVNFATVYCTHHATRLFYSLFLSLPRLCLSVCLSESMFLCLSFGLICRVLRMAESCFLRATAATAFRAS